MVPLGGGIGLPGVLGALQQLLQTNEHVHAWIGSDITAIPFGQPCLLFFSGDVYRGEIACNPPLSLLAGTLFWWEHIRVGISPGDCDALPPNATFFIDLAQNNEKQVCCTCDSDILHYNICIILHRTPLLVLLRCGTCCNFPTVRRKMMISAGRRATAIGVVGVGGMIGPNLLPPLKRR